MADQAAALTLPPLDKQVAFHANLKAARKKWLPEALREAIAKVDPDTLADEIRVHVPHAMRALLKDLGMREEHLFPLPCLLRRSPTLLGYYRLLLGVSQKQLFNARTGFGPFQSMELTGTLSRAQEARLDELCGALAAGVTAFLSRVQDFAAEDIEDLQLLTLGAQFDGGWRNRIGQVAAQDVFAAIRSMITDAGVPIVTQQASRIAFQNAAGRIVDVVLAADPDVGIREGPTAGDVRPRVALEVKGGLDGSNAYNRAGEAEKSHVKAREAGYRDFWTVIDTENTSTETVRSSSPSTRAWFELRQVQAREGDSWTEFRRELYQVLGLPEAPPG